jgi:hypothetical protein
MFKKNCLRRKVLIFTQKVASFLGPAVPTRLQTLVDSKLMGATGLGSTAQLSQLW